jgi:hypothetical protein
MNNARQAQEFFRHCEGQSPEAIQGPRSRSLFVMAALDAAIQENSE